MDVAGLNFSHGDPDDHKRVYDMIRAAADAEGPRRRDPRRPAGAQDPAGSVRYRAWCVEWRTGEEVRITVDDVPGAHDRVSTTYQGLTADARPDDRLPVDDGKVGLRVTSVEGNDVVCRVTEGGRGIVCTKSTSPQQHGWTGTTIGDFTEPAEAGHRPSSRPCTSWAT